MKYDPAMIGEADLRTASRVLDEREWRSRPGPFEAGARQVTLSRWRLSEPKSSWEVCSRQIETCHVVSMSLIPVRASFLWNGVRVLDGDIPAFSILVTGPRFHECSATFDGGADILRAYIPHALISECLRVLFPERSTVRGSLWSARILSDAKLALLMRALMSIDQREESLIPTLAEGIGIGLTARLIGLLTNENPAPEEASRNALAHWRLMRVTEYIDANLSKPISLEDLSRVAGLSKIRFGAQFRKATGTTPYAFILNKRMDHAKRLLADSKSSLAEIALEAGFGSQAHFTTVFTRTVGLSPGRWRRTAREREVRA